MNRGVVDREEAGGGFTYALVIRDLASQQNGLVNKIDQPASQQNGLPLVNDIDYPSQQNRLEVVNEIDHYTPVLKKEKESIKEKTAKKEAATPRAPSADVEFSSPASEKPAPEKTLTPQQAMYGAICEAIGWDYRVIKHEDKQRVGEVVAICHTAGYTVEDIRRFMVDIWFHDWRWEKHSQYPTLDQLRQEIGKLRSVAKQVSPPKKLTGLEKFKEIARGQGTPL
jgi:hypothetical protein